MSIEDEYTTFSTKRGCDPNNCMGVSTCQISTHGPNDDFLPTNVTNFSGAEYWAQPNLLVWVFFFWVCLGFFV